MEWNGERGGKEGAYDGRWDAHGIEFLLVVLTGFGRVVGHEDDSFT